MPALDESWTTRPSLAFGTSADIDATARVFSDVAEAMNRALPIAEDFNARNGDVWQGESADEARAQMSDVPEFLRRFFHANNDVAKALETFSPLFAEYQQEHQRLRSQGRETWTERVNVDRQRDLAIDRVRSASFDPMTALVSAEMDPDVRNLSHRLDQLTDDFLIAQRQLEEADEDFEVLVAQIVDIIDNADRVLYDSDWDKFWSQTAAPVIAVVKVALEIISVVVMILVLAGSLGTLAPFVLAVMLTAVTLIEIAGTAAAGDEITGDMWLELGINVAGVITGGMARWAKPAAKSMKAASAAHRTKADKFLKAKTSLSNAGEAGAHIRQADKLDNMAWWLDKGTRGSEMIEGGLVATEGGILLAEGMREGDLGKAIGGGVGLVAGGFDLGGFEAPGFGRVGGSENLFGDGAKIGHGIVGGIDGIGDILDGIPDEPGEASPTEWPGLDNGSSAR